MKVFVSVPIPGTISPNNKKVIIYNNMQLGFRPHSGDYISKSQKLYILVTPFSSFRPHSGDYISKYQRRHSGFNAGWFPSPFRGLYLQIEQQQRIRNIKMFPSPFRGLYLQMKMRKYENEYQQGFRPHSGDYISK